MRFFLLILFFILPLEIFADGPSEKFIAVGENDKEFTSDSGSDSTEKVSNTDKRKNRKYRRQRNRSHSSRQGICDSTIKNDSCQAANGKQGRGKNRKMDKFVDEDGDGINDNRCKGTGLRQHKGKGRKCGRHRRKK